MSVKRMLIHKLSMAAYDNVKIEKKADSLMRSLKEVKRSLDKIGRKK